MDKIGYNESRSNNHQKKPNSRRNHIIGQNSKKLDKRTRSLEITEKE